MRKGWGRWRGYLDELEEGMRSAGVHLDEVEALLSAAFERDAWREKQTHQAQRPAPSHDDNFLSLADKAAPHHS